MLKRDQSDNAWQMHLIELDQQPNDPFYMHTIFSNGNAIGMVTSGAYGHRVNKALALAYFKTMPKPDDQISVSILGDSVNARMLKRPPYDPENLRIKC